MLATVAVVVLTTTHSQSQELRELVQVGITPIEAKLEAIDAEGVLRLRGKAGELVSVSADALVRWSTPAPLRSVDAVLLADGSVLTLAPAWSARPSFTFDGVTGEARTRRAGRIAIKRAVATALLLKLPRSDMQVARVIEKVQEMHARGDSDQLFLDNGDLVSGRILRVGAEAGANRVVFEADFGAVELPLDRVRAVIFADAREASQRAITSNNPKLSVGLDDGSLITATSLATHEGELRIDSPLIGPLKISSIDEIAFLQSVGGRVTYLSDLEPVSYRYEPFLELPWQYQRNLNVLGQPLRVGEQAYLKGVGMHSRSRLTYDLDGAHQTFAAAVALDDIAETGGSSIFRVLLAHGGKWEEVWSSDIVRGGQPARHVRVGLAGADQLRLAVDYADRGDQRDYANWIDARLEPAP
jgi:hypothetical protein